MPTGEAQAEGAAAKRIYVGDAKHAENGTHEKVRIRCCAFTSTMLEVGGGNKNWRSMFRNVIGRSA